MPYNHIIEITKIVVILFYSVVLHEYAHGWMADRLGDPTAKNMGRLTLNPFKHIDPFGTIILPILLFVMRSPVFLGWAKPVPVNFLNLRNPKRDMMWVGLAGPAVNITLAIFFGLLLKLPLSPFGEQFAKTAISINLVLAVFNLIPVPPLDGSRLLMGVLPRQMVIPYSRLEPIGIPIVMVLLYLGLFSAVVVPIVTFLEKILGAS